MRLYEWLLTGIMLLFCTYINAQNKPGNTLKGRVFIENHIACNAALVLLTSVNDSTVAATTLTNDAGIFAFNHVDNGRYYVVLKQQNYVTYRSEILAASSGRVFSFSDINLLPANTRLREVTIINKKAFIESQPDKIILNVSRGVVTAGTSVLDVLATAPGVRVSSSDVLTYRAGQPPLILINGKAIQPATHDMATMLRNMASGDVETIELISNPSVKYDASGTGGVINIITKKGAADGFNGSISTGIEQGNYLRKNTGLNVNYRADRLNVFGSFSVSDNKSDHVINTDRNIGPSARFETFNSATMGVVNPTYRIGADLMIDSVSTLGFLFNGFVNNIDLNKHTNSLIWGGGYPDSVLYTASGVDRHISQNSYNVNYTGQLGQSGQRISMDIDYSRYSRTSNEDIKSQLTDILKASNNNTLNYINYTNTNYNIVSGKADYVRPFKYAKLEAGIKYCYVKSDNIQRFDSLANNIAVTDSFLSSHFLYTDHTAAAYATYRGRTANSRLSYLAGLRAESRTSDANALTTCYHVKRTYNNLYPQIQLNYKLNNNHRLLLDANRRTDQPLYEDLNPMIIYQDRYTFRMGNAYLRPAYKNTVQLTHVYKDRFFTALSYSRVTDFFGFTYFAQNDTSKIFITTKANLKSVTNYEFTFNTTVNIAPWWNANIDADVIYQHFVDYLGFLNQHTFDAVCKLNQQFVLPASFVANLYGQYEVPTNFTIYHYQASYYVKAGISKKVLKNRAIITLTMDDVFNTRRDRYSSNYFNLNMAGYDKKETRLTSLSFSWQFGKRSVKASRRHVNGNYDEQKRIGGVS